MISKAIALLLLAASAVAGPLAEGTYRITNVDSQSTAREYFAGAQIFVSSDNSNPGPYELWNITNAKDDGYTIDNVGLNIVLMLDTFAAVHPPEDGEPVVTDRVPTVFNIEPAGGDAFVIKVQDEDLVWNVEPPVVPTGDVTVRRAVGTDVQKWEFTAAPWPPA